MVICAYFIIDKVRKMEKIKIMKLTNINGFATIDKYVEDKIKRYGAEEKNFQTLFSYMFSEKNNILTESADGYRIQKVTYGECETKIKTLSFALSNKFQNLPQGAIIGLYMANSLAWIQTFWSILSCGYRPLLLNSRLPKTVLEQTLADYEVAAVVSDGESFSIPTYLTADIFAEDNGTEYTPTVWGEEVLFMSSGTTGSVKLCAYTAENFYYQICSSVDIIKTCPQMRMHYEGELKLLALLPFYHIFGFAAVYLWFTFVSRTLVFLTDMNPQTLLNTIKRHKITHIFAVPLVWTTIYKKALRSIRQRGDKTYQKFEKGLRTVNKLGWLGARLSKSWFKEVREGLFGESVCFLISGGSSIEQETLQFFNGIGYHMANGFGMTEIGITSVERSMQAKMRNSGSIGLPFKGMEYSISEKGELLVRGKAMASRIWQDKQENVTDFNAWFNTKDLVEKRGKGYYHQGRKDDLIVCKNGENLNPELMENKLYTDGVKKLCLFAGNEGKPTLLVCIEPCFSKEKLQEVYERIKRKLVENHLQDEVEEISLTTDDLLETGAFKISRKKIAVKYRAKGYHLIDLQNTDAYVEHALSQLEAKICKCFAETLQLDEKDVYMQADFFTDLGGSSLDYFVLIDALKAEFEVETAVADDVKLSTPQDFYELLKNLA